MEWTGAEDAKTPASATDVAESGPRPLGGRGPLVLGLLSLALSLIALGLSLRREGPRTARA